MFFIPFGNYRNIGMNGKTTIVFEPQRDRVDGLKIMYRRNYEARGYRFERFIAEFVKLQYVMTLRKC